MIRTVRIFIILLLSIQLAEAQTIADIVRQANRDRNNGLYLKAINIYKEALEREPRHRGAKFGLAESYRLILDYEQAEYYYNLVSRSDDPNFASAKYYHGLMAKLNGKYAEALTILQGFEEFMVERELTENDRLKYFFKQAKIEIDGCQLALNQMTMSHPDHVFAPLPEPANSEFNDYAAFSLDNDSLICLTSARKSGKGGLQDNQFGESYSDLFRFSYTGNQWENYDPGDRFDKVINTKWGDGSGSFNQDRTKFYYTNCEESLGDVCHIFVSELIGGRWSDPKPLNRNVNDPKFNSRHPNLSPRGDTLFFASDRTGSFGELDIWMSVNAGGDNWGPAVNLGKHVNTAFNEISPFFDHNQKVLFFASNGHRGFGGFDIYVARGNTLSNSEIYNAGVPFNSNKDDMFFFLGNKRGYLSSNRDQGVGKIDIYGFNIESKRDILSEVSNESTIAGRNSLFADDFNFDNRNTEVINQIISRKLSAAVTGADLVLTTDQLEVFNSLSEDDKGRIDRIVDARLRKMSSNDLRSVRSQDDFYYQNLSTDKRQQVDQLVTSYLEQQGLGLAVSLTEQDNTFYQSVDIKEQEQLDIFISDRLQAAKEYLPQTPNYDALSSDQKERVDGIVTKYVEQKRSLERLTLSVQENAFVNSMDNPVQVNYAIRERLVALSQLPEFELEEEDKIFYQNLTAQHKESLKEVASSFLSSDISAFEQTASSEDMQVMSQYTGKRGETMDKLMVKLFSNLADADLYLIESYFSADDLRALGSASPEVAYNQLVRNRRDLSEADRFAIKRFVYSGFQSYLQNDEPVFVNMMDEMAVVASDNLDDNEIKRSIYPTPTIPPTVNPDELAISGNYQEYLLGQTQSFDPVDVRRQYVSLPESKRKAVDRIVAVSLINQEYDANDLLAASDEQYYEDLDVAEQGLIDVVAKSIGSESLDGAEKKLLESATSSYFTKAQSEQKQWARLAYKTNMESNGREVSLSAADANVQKNLSNEDIELINNLVTIRAASGHWLPFEKETSISSTSTATAEISEREALQRYAEFVPERQLLFDRLAAQQYVDRFYGDNPTIRSADKEYLESLPEQIQEYARLMSQRLKQLDLTDQETADLARGLNYFDSLDPVNKLKFSRAVYQSVFIEENGRLKLSGEDQRAAEQLSANDRQIVQALVNSRLSSGSYLNIASLAPQPTRTLLSLSPIVKTTYESWTEEQVIAANQTAGVRFLNDAYATTPALVSSDEAYYENASPEIKNYITALSRKLKGSKLDNRETQAALDGIDYFKKLSEKEKPAFSRLIFNRGLEINKGTYSISPTYQSVLNDFDTDDQKVLNDLIEYRLASGEFIDDNWITRPDNNLVAQSEELDPSIQASYNQMPLDQRLLIERAIGVDYLNQSYNASSGLQSADATYAAALAPRVQGYVQALAAPLKNDVQNAETLAKAKEGLDYYNALPSDQKAAFARTVYRSSFTQEGSSYILEPLDEASITGMEPAQKEVLDQLKAYRANSGDLLSSTLLAPVPVKKEEDPVIELSSRTLSAYEELSPSGKLQWDRLIALDYLNEIYANAQNRKGEDALFYKQLDQREKDYVKMLAKHFSGQALKPAERAFLNESFTQYNSLSLRRKEQFNTVILSRVFEDTNGKFKLKQEDQRAKSQLSAEAEGMVAELLRFRTQNQRIITENQAPEAYDQASSTVALQLPAYNADGFKDITITGQLIGNTSGNPMAEHPVSLISKNDQEQKRTIFTNSNGEFVFTVPNATYEVVTENTTESVYVKDFSIKGVQVVPEEIFTKYTQVYFDSDASGLRPEGRALLEEIAVEYKKGTIKVNMEAHTDNVGNERYNEQLSRKRGFSALDYLNDKGVPKSDLSVQWYGKEKPKAVNSSPYGRQLNRRLDIELAANTPIKYNPGSYFLVRPNVTVAQIAASTNLSTAKIRTWNGLTGNSLSPYQPLRLKLPAGMDPDLSLLIPSSSSAASDDYSYKVRPGESVISIAQKFNIPEEIIMEMNNLTSPELKPGQILNIYVKYK